MWTKKFQMFKVDLENAEKPEIKLPTSTGSLKKQESSRKTSTSALLITQKAFDHVDHNKLEFLKRWEYQTTWPASWETCMQVRKQQLELDMEQETDPVLPVSVQESLAEAWVSGSLLQGWGHWV